MIVDLDVIVDVIASVVVAALVNGNDTVGVFDTVDIKLDQIDTIITHDAFEQLDSVRIELGGVPPVRTGSIARALAIGRLPSAGCLLSTVSITSTVSFPLTSAATTTGAITFTSTSTSTSTRPEETSPHPA